MMKKSMKMMSKNQEEFESCS